MFNVAFPESLSPEVARKLETAFSKQPGLGRKSKRQAQMAENEDQEEEVKMEEFDGQGQWRGGQEEEEEDEEEDEHGGRHGGFGGRGMPRGAAPGPQCAQQ